MSNITYEARRRRMTLFGRLGLSRHASTSAVTIASDKIPQLFLRLCDAIFHSTCSSSLVVNPYKNKLDDDTMYSTKVHSSQLWGSHETTELIKA